MGIKINDIKITDKDYYFINEDNDILENLKKINIFIGENNSGKSRFLRQIFYQNESSLIFKQTDESFYESLDMFENFTSDLGEYSSRFREHGISDTDILYKFKETYYKELKKELKKDNPNRLKIMNIMDDIKGDLKDLPDNLRLGRIERGSVIETLYSKSFSTGIDSIINDNFKKGIGFVKSEGRFTFEKLYIPILRGLRPLNNENYDHYARRTIQDYFNQEKGIMDENDNLIICTGLNYYKVLKKHLLGDLKKRQLVRNYEEYLSETFYDGRPVVLIPKENKEVIWVKIGNESEKPIYELGDGIQSIIIITFPLFLSMDKIKSSTDAILVLIEEPEQHLHPALQRKLIETFHDNRFQNYQFFFTTHSNHFIDNIINYDDVVAFSFKKKLKNNTIEEDPTFCISPVTLESTSIFDELGILPLSALIPNCNIIVEGTSDKIHYRKYLKLYQGQENIEKFKENYHYSFGLSGGSEIVNILKDLDEKQKERMFFIVDSDNNREKQEKMFEKYNCKNYCVLNCRTVENLLEPDVIKSIIKHHPQGKKFNINEEFSDYEDKKLASFMDNEILKEVKEEFSEENLEKPIFANDKGNFSDKISFAGRMDKNVNEYNDLSDEAKKIAEEIHNFIIEKNNV